MTVQVATAQRKVIQQEVTADAVIYPLHQAAIVPKIGAPVSRFYVERGSHVHAGELLAELESKDLAAAVTENKGAYQQAEATYQTTIKSGLPEEMQKAQLDLKAAKEARDAQQKVFDARQNLYQQGAIPRKDLEDATVALTQARNQYDIAKQHLDKLMAIGKQQELKAAQGQRDSAKGKYLETMAALSYSEIRSPINGVVTDRPLYPGEMAAAGTPLLTVMDISSVIAKAHIPQNDAAALRVGDKGTMTVPGIEQPIDGKVTVVSPALDPNSTTVEVWFEAKNPQHELKPGTSVTVSLTAQTVKDALVVSVSSILTAPDGSTTVMLAGSEGLAHQKAVKLGIRSGDDVQIVDGVTDGDKVVTSGAYGLPDKTKIKVEAAAPADQAKPSAEGAKTSGEGSSEK